MNLTVLDFDYRIACDKVNIYSIKKDHKVTLSNLGNGDVYFLLGRYQQKAPPKFYEMTTSEGGGHCTLYFGELDDSGSHFQDWGRLEIDINSETRAENFDFRLGLIRCPRWNYGYWDSQFLEPTDDAYEKMVIATAYSTVAGEYICNHLN